MSRWGSCDFSQLKRWAKKIDRATREGVAEQFITEVLHELGNRLLDETKRNTPFISGHLRRNWQISNVTRKGDMYEIEVYNNVEYAPFVEYGHRIVVKGITVGFVEGRYMMHLSAQKMETLFPRLLEKRSRDLLVKIFGAE